MDRALNLNPACQEGFQGETRHQRTPERIPFTSQTAEWWLKREVTCSPGGTATLQQVTDKTPWNSARKGQTEKLAQRQHAKTLSQLQNLMSDFTPTSTRGSHCSAETLRCWNCLSPTHWRLPTTSTAAPNTSQVRHSPAQNGFLLRLSPAGHGVHSIPAFPLRLAKRAVCGTHTDSHRGLIIRSQVNYLEDDFTS